MTTPPPQKVFIVAGTGMPQEATALFTSPDVVVVKVGGIFLSLNPAEVYATPDAALLVALKVAQRKADDANARLRDITADLLKLRETKAAPAKS